ncbi:MAG TPA: glycosyltransferase [Solirubrobacteraceae bacterium]|nr:glycosyltransferase [Solirubrobacteraceae bacterium]
MRVLMVSQPADGGAFEHVVRLAKGLRGRGHEVTLCGPLGGLEGIVGGDVERLEMTREISIGRDAHAAVGLARIVRRVRPDVIHAHSSKAGALARAGRAAAPRVPVVYTPHGFAFAGFVRREADRILYRAIERGLAPLASRTLCVCEAEGRLAASVGPVRRVRVVHNGIDPLPAGEPAPELAELRRSGPVIGVLSLLRPGKGVETLVEAMRQVSARHPSATVAIAGDGSERPVLEARIRAAGLDGRVRLIGMTAGPVPLLRGSDVFCNPSWAESLPLSLLEAMHLDLPIVSTAVGGCPEAIEDGRTGLLVAPRDPAALARALIAVLDDPRMARDLGERAGRVARERFTSDRMVQDTLGVYQEVLRH